jgi:hypothetical protein
MVYWCEEEDGTWRTSLTWSTRSYTNCQSHDSGAGIWWYLCKVLSYITNTYRMRIMNAVSGILWRTVTVIWRTVVWLRDIDFALKTIENLELQGIRTHWSCIENLDTSRNPNYRTKQMAAVTHVSSESPTVTSQQIGTQSLKWPKNCRTDRWVSNIFFYIFYTRCACTTSQIYVKRHLVWISRLFFVPPKFQKFWFRAKPKSIA